MEDRNPTEKFVRHSRIDTSGEGRPLSDRALHRERTVAGYLKGEVLPRYITRARDIEKATAAHRDDLAEVRDELREALGDDDAFAAAWSATVEAWDFDAVNLLVEQHNAWYPIERDLPMDPRTGAYIGAFGQDFRRRPLDAAWALAQFAD